MKNNKLLEVRWVGLMTRRKYRIDRLFSYDMTGVG
jgi:hypothetical protein